MNVLNPHSPLFGKAAIRPPEEPEEFFQEFFRRPVPLFRLISGLLGYTYSGGLMSRPVYPA